MKKFFNYICIVFALITFACENNGELSYLADDVTNPEITQLPDLTLSRARGAETLNFIGSNVDPGFTASASYVLEAAESGTSFATPATILMGDHADTMSINVAAFNQLMLDYFPEDETSSVDFRIRSTLTVDGGNGAPGTGSDLFEYTSETQTADMLLFGLMRLDLINSGIDQKLVSPMGNGEYSNFVKLDEAYPFTILDPETSTTYGGSEGSLTVDGSAINVDSEMAGWNIMDANINDLSYTLTAYRIGLIGDATPNVWETPDQKMDYNSESGLWEITIDLTDGEIKFRKNDDWAWNLGLDATDNTKLVGSGDNIPVTAGNYTIKLDITDDEGQLGTFELISND